MSDAARPHRDRSAAWVGDQAELPSALGIMLDVLEAGPGQRAGALGRRLLRTAPAEAVWLLERLGGGATRSIALGEAGLLPTSGAADAMPCGHSLIPDSGPHFCRREGMHCLALLAGEPGAPFAAMQLARRSSPFGPDDATRMERLLDLGGLALAQGRAADEARDDRAFTGLFRSAAEAMLVIDPEGRIAAFNPAAEHLTGLTSQAVLGRRPEEVFSRDLALDLVEVLAGGQRISGAVPVPRRGRPSGPVEVALPRPDGHVRMVQVSVSLASDGGTGPMLAVLRDVTDHARIQEQLLQAEKMAAIGQLVGGMAHEVNNPLASIAVNTELLEADLTDPGQRESVRAIRSETERAAAIVRNLLTYVRGQGSERSAVELRQVVEEAIALRRYQLRSRHIEVHQLLSPRRTMVWANAGNLQQVLMNLIANAEHAIREHRRSGEIWVRVEQDEARAVVRVEDDGPGVPAGALTRIFDPFYTTKPKGVGTGLGLSVSAGIIADHGGRMWAENRAGGGAAFVVELPLRQEEAVPAAPAPAPKAISSGRLLLVDDDPALRRSVARLLGRWGWEVIPADSGPEALALLEVGRFSLVLCDLRMPGMSGPEFYRALVERESPMADRVVFMSGDTVSSEATTFLSSTNRPVLAKPFTMAELEAVLREGENA